MLNKKILVGGAGEEAPHVKLKVGSLTFIYGWTSMGDIPYGSISRVPVWEGIRLTNISAFIATNSPYTECSFSGKIPEDGISIRRLDTGYEIKTEGSVESSKVPGALFTRADKDKEILLVFTPPYRISLRKSRRYLPALERRAW